jgi:excinuclease ABC subunit B
VISELEKQMKQAAQNLEFEKAAIIRDQIYELRGVLADSEDAAPWKRARILAGG